MKQLMMFVICLIVLLTSENINAQDLKVTRDKDYFIYQDSMYSLFYHVPDTIDKPYYVAPSFKFMNNLNDTVRIKQLVNHLGRQFLNDEIKRIVKEENQKQKKDVFFISLRYDKQGKMVCASIIIGENLRDEVTDEGVRDLYAAVMRSTIGPQFLENATRVDKNQPDATTGMLQIYLVPQSEATTFSWLTLDMGE